MKTLCFGWLAAIVALFMLLLRTTGWRLPDRYDPWAPLVVADTPNVLTSIKLARLSRNAGLCRSVLAATPFRFEPLADHRQPDGCGWQDAVRIRSTQLRVNSSFILSCPAAASLAMWERHVVEPSAMDAFGQQVAAIEHVGSYACRDVRGSSRSNLSRHATADALDVSAFVLADGQRVEIGRAWRRGTPAQQQFLRAAHAGACAWFDEVLGPDYNAAHSAHFHLDRGTGRVCR